MKTPAPLDPATARLMRWAEEEALKATERALGHGRQEDETEEPEATACENCDRKLRRFESGWCDRCTIENGDAFSEREEHDLDMSRDE